LSLTVGKTRLFPPKAVEPTDWFQNYDSEKVSREISNYSDSKPSNPICCIFTQTICLQIPNCPTPCRENLRITDSTVLMCTISILGEWPNFRTQLGSHKKTPVMIRIFGCLAPFLLKKARASQRGRIHTLGFMGDAGPWAW